MTKLDAWLTDALLHARNTLRENARRGVSSYASGFDTGWVAALEEARSVLNVEGSHAMNFFKILKVIGEVMTDLPQLEAMAAGLTKGQLPTPAEIALLIKLIDDVKAAV